MAERVEGGSWAGGRAGIGRERGGRRRGGAYKYVKRTERARGRAKAGERTRREGWRAQKHAASDPFQSLFLPSLPSQPHASRQSLPLGGVGLAHLRAETNISPAGSVNRGCTIIFQPKSVSVEVVPVQRRSIAWWRSTPCLCPVVCSLTFSHQRPPLSRHHSFLPWFLLIERFLQAVPTLSSDAHASRRLSTSRITSSSTTSSCRHVGASGHSSPRRNGRSGCSDSVQQSFLI